jgi:hypothetical protein
MSILDDARRLADMSPDGDDGRGDTVCVYCLADHYIRDGAAFTRADDVQHAPDCPWLSMPKIVEALKAAEAVLWAADAVAGVNLNSIFPKRMVAAIEVLEIVLDAGDVGDAEAKG